MFCEECHKNLATVHLTQMVDNKVSKVHLCQECAKKFSESASFDLFLSLPEFLSTLFELHQPQSPEELFEETKTCPNCDTSFSDIRETGKVGCSKCYEIFSPKLEPIFKKIHTSVEHRGKIPKSASGEVKRKLKISDLEQKLETYIEKEEFEKAAILRDQIKNLKAKSDIRIGREPK